MTGYAVHAPWACNSLNQNGDGLGQRIQPPVFQQSVRRNQEMDYIIAGIASVVLFVYLVYALLRPEKF